MATSHAILTEAEFDQLPEAQGVVRELLDGELIEMPSPTFLHQDLLAELLSALRGFLVQHGMGRALPQLKFRLRPGLRLEPDICVLFEETLRNIDSRRTPIDGCPDIAIAILSPSETVAHANSKRKAYLEAGVKEVWQIDPEICEAILWSPEPVRCTDTLTSVLLPRFELKLAALLQIPE